MTSGREEKLRPGIAIREIVQQATEALVSMNATRLEELARCCAELNREIDETGMRTTTTGALQEFRPDFDLLGRVLSKTRSNLTILFRLHALRLAEAGVLQQSRSVGHADYSGVMMDVFNRTEKATAYGDN
jgi:hypothetical protein